jgi:hypothetical protein
VGFGGLVGAATASHHRRRVLPVNYALRQIEGDRRPSLGVSVGGLFSRGRKDALSPRSAPGDRRARGPSR